MRAALRRAGDSLASPPGGRRRPGRAALALLAAALLLATGVVIGRSGALAPEAVDEGPGPMRLADGVPVGYARSEDGAVAAALNLSAVLDGEMLGATAQRRAAILDLVASPAGRDTLLQQYAQAVPAATEGGEAVDGPARRVPAGVRVQSYSPREAVVDVWGTWAVATSEGLEPNVAWGTTRLRLVWEEDDWRVVAVERVDGPSTRQPPDRAAGTDPADFEDLVYGRRR